MSDVYCFGHVSTGQILRLQGRFPAPDGYGEVAETLAQVNNFLAERGFST